MRLTTRLPFATRLANHLAESRRQGISFDIAWKRATAAEKPEPDQFGWPIDDTKRWMRQGYERHQVGRKGGDNMSAIMDRDRIYKDPSLRVAVAVERRCGWGGKPCEAEARDGGWLCDEHAAVIHAFPPLCVGPRCENYAHEDTAYCKRHQRLAAGQRNAAALRRKAA